MNNWTANETTIFNHTYVTYSTVQFKNIKKSDYYTGIGVLKVLIH